MADAWEILYANSTLQTGDAWEHLNNQEGGGGGGYAVLADGLGITVDNSVHLVKMKKDKFLVSMQSDTQSINVANNFITASVDNNETAISLDNKYNITIDGAGAVYLEGEMITKQTGMDVVGYRAVVTNSDGDIIYADKDAIFDGKRVIGITTQSALTGTQCALAIGGNEIYNDSWTWDINKPIYLGDDGILLQVPPTEGFVLILGIPLEEKSIRVRVEMPIFL